MIVAEVGEPFTAQKRCPVCRQHHLTFQRRTDGIGFVCNYRQPDEHYHDTEEERLVLCGDGNYTPQQYERAAKAMQGRTGTRGKHPRKPSQRPADKPTSVGEAA